MATHLPNTLYYWAHKIISYHFLHWSALKFILMIKIRELLCLSTSRPSWLGISDEIQVAPGKNCGDYDMIISHDIFLLRMRRKNVIKYQLFSRYRNEFNDIIEIELMYLFTDFLVFWPICCWNWRDFENTKMEANVIQYNRVNMNHCVIWTQNFLNWL